SLLTTHYSLLTTHYSLLTTHYSLLTTHYSLLTTHYSLLTTHYSLLTTQNYRALYRGGRVSPTASITSSSSMSTFARRSTMRSVRITVAFGNGGSGDRRACAITSWKRRRSFADWSTTRSRASSAVFAASIDVGSSIEITITIEIAISRRGCTLDIPGASQ